VCVTATALQVSINRVKYHTRNCRKGPGEKAADYVPGNMEQEQRANRNVKTKRVSAEPLEIGPIRRRMGWVLAANQVRHSTDTSLS
jgi:hypothetical protein